MAPISTGTETGHTEVRNRECTHSITSSKGSQRATSQRSFSEREASAEYVRRIVILVPDLIGGPVCGAVLPYPRPLRLLHVAALTQYVGLSFQTQIIGLC